jgi:hypothetical protein
MEYKLTRRRFGKLAIASTTVAGLSYVASKTLAQTPNSQTSSMAIVGVRPGSPTSADTAATNLRIAADTGEATSSPSYSQQLIMQRLNLGWAEVQRLSAPRVQGGATSTVEFDEAITGLAYLADGTLVMAVTPVRTSNRGNTPTRLKFMSSSRSDLTVSGLQQHEKLKSLLGTKDGKLLGLVGKKNGTPPYRLVEVNLQTGSFKVRLNLPQNQRFSNLAQCPDGKIYTTFVEGTGATHLVQLDLRSGKPITQVQLKLNNKIWNNGLESLVCSRSNQIIGFGALRYQSPKALHIIDPSNGTMTKLTDFDVAKIAMRPS